MDLVIPLLEGSGNNYTELRYALRSFEQFLPHDRIVIIGMCCPNWIDTRNPSVLFLSFRDDPNPKYREANIFLKVKYYIEKVNDEEEFVLCNDDYFLLENCNPYSPYPHKGTLMRSYTEYGVHNGYRNTIWNTIKVLGGDALNLDVHYPMSMSGNIFKKIFGEYKERAVQSQHPIQWSTPFGYLFKSLYGQQFSKAWLYEDTKINIAKDLIKCSEFDFPFNGAKAFSTQDQAVITDSVYVLEKLYPNLSQYEQ